MTAFTPGDAESFVAAYFPNAKPRGHAQWSARCPAHDDAQPSLSIGQGERGVLLKCFAGCTVEAICRALGIQVGALSRSVQVAGRANGRYDATSASAGRRTEYLYRDEHGTPLYRRTRVDLPDGHKRIWQDRAVGGRWESGLADTPRVLYRLPELVHADPAEPVFVVEGEKCADALARRGKVVTTSGAADSWRAEFARYFANRVVVILPDNDAPGREYGLAAARSVYPVASRVFLLDLPGLPPKGDVYDWLAAGHQADELVDLALEVGPWEPTLHDRGQADATPDEAETGDEEITIPGGYPLTDLGNAERLSALFGDRVRYVHAWRDWLVWDGARWRRDDTGELGRCAKETVRRIRAEADGVTSDDENGRHRRRAILSWAAKSESRGRIEALLKLAENEPGQQARPDELDADPWLLTVANGTLDLRTGGLRAHKSADLITKLAPVTYDPAATCPRWEAFLARILAYDTTMIRFLQQAVGYTLTGRITEQCFFVMHGRGRNGKSTFVSLVQKLLGDYARRTSSETLTLSNRHDSSSATPERAMLKGARFVFASETAEGARLDEGYIKDVTGGDTVIARFLYSHSFEFKPQFKLWLASNHRPRIVGTDDGIWRRVRYIPFEVQIPEDEVDRDLADKLEAELPGILAWAVRGCLDWQQSGLVAPDKVQQATQDYRAEMDTLGGWLAECCVVSPTAKTKSADALASFRTHTGIDMSPHKFGALLKERGFANGRDDKARYWQGFGLLAEPETLPDYYHR